MWPNPDYQLAFSKPVLAWQLWRWPGAVLVSVLALLVIVKYLDMAGTEAQLQQLAQRQLQLTTQRMRIATTAHPPAVKAEARPVVRNLSLPQQKAAEGMLQQLNVHWFDLLQALESRQVPEIALLQLLPDAHRGQFVLSGEAKSYQDLLKYVSQLQAVATLRQVHLQKHQVNESHPQRPVSFEIQGGWQP